MSENLDTFDSDVVIEPNAPTNTAGQTADPEMDTFDNDIVIDPSEESKEEVKSKDAKPEQELKDKQINQMDDAEKVEVKKEEKKESEDESPKSKEEDAEGERGDDEQDSEGDEKAPKVKPIKGRVGDDRVEINPETEVKVKVAGKREAVSVRDLIDNYAGKKNWDQEYTKLGEEKKAFQEENTQYKQELNWLQGNIKEVVGILDDPERNPVDALMHLVDVTNRNPVQFQMKLFKHLQGQIEDMSEMDEVEQELYWERQKNDYLSKRQESLSQKAKSDTEERNLKARIDTLREAQGVSEEQFMEAHSELESLGFENVTPEQAVNFATIKPHLDVAEELVKPYEEDMTTDGADKLISDFANYLKSGEFSRQELEELLREEYASDDEVRDLEDKVKDFAPKESKSGPAKVADRGESHVESFDDFDDYAQGRTYNF